MGQKLLAVYFTITFSNY